MYILHIVSPILEIIVVKWGGSNHWCKLRLFQKLLLKCVWVSICSKSYYKRLYRFWLYMSICQFWNKRFGPCWDFFSVSMVTITFMACNIYFLQTCIICTYLLIYVHSITLCSMFWVIITTVLLIIDWDNSTLIEVVFNWGSSNCGTHGHQKSNMF